MTAMDGDALNCLTREEWNAAYFLGLQKIMEGRAQGNLAAQVRAGVEELCGCGYTFQRLERGPDGSLRPNRIARGGEHQAACREILAGEFDPIERARVALAWLRPILQEEKADWLGGLVSLYDRTHTPYMPGSAFKNAAPSIL
jgi:hypothetical protein